MSGRAKRERKTPVDIAPEAKPASVRKGKVAKINGNAAETPILDSDSNPPLPSLEVQEGITVEPKKKGRRAASKEPTSSSEYIPQLSKSRARKSPVEVNGAEAKKSARGAKRKATTEEECEVSSTEPDLLASKAKTSKLKKIDEEEEPSTSKKSKSKSSKTKSTDDESNNEEKEQKTKSSRSSKKDEAPKPKKGGRTKKLEPISEQNGDSKDEDVKQDEVAKESKSNKRGTSKKTSEDNSNDGEPKPKKGRTAKRALSEEPSKEPEEQNGDIPEDKKGSKSKKTKKSEEEIPKTSQEAETKPKKGRTRKASSEEPKTDEPKAKKGRTRKAVETTEKDVLVDGTSSKPEEPKPKKGRATKKTKDTEEVAPIKDVDTEKDDLVDGTSSSKSEEPKPKKGRTTKKTKETEEIAPIKDVVSNENIEDDFQEPSPKKSKTKSPKAEKMNSTVTNYSDIDFSLTKEFNLKISSWNVAGLRSWLNKDGLKYLEHEKPDILCLQEIKCEKEKLPDEARIPGYHPYWLCNKGGYAGVAIYSKIMPINVEYGIGDKEQDENGRIITAEYEKFFLVCVYVPNSGRGLVTLDKRLRWNTLFKDFISNLNSNKPVIIAGDMNVSHQEIDLARPQTNKKSAGFTQEERDGMSDFLASGFVDTFRHFYKDKTGAYTYWTYMANARSKNVGWRLDYFLVSERITNKIVDNVIRNQVLGSDHCPITLFANF